MVVFIPVRFATHLAQLPMIHAGQTNKLTQPSKEETAALAMIEIDRNGSQDLDLWQKLCLQAKDCSSRDSVEYVDFGRISDARDWA